MYSYTAAGLVAANGMQVTRQVPDKNYQGVIQYTNNSFLASAGYVYDGEGRVTSMSYPDSRYDGAAVYGGADGRTDVRDAGDVWAFG